MRSGPVNRKEEVVVVYEIDVHHWACPLKDRFILHDGT